jgi:hypothetical protein
MQCGKIFWGLFSRFVSKAIDVATGDQSVAVRNRIVKHALKPVNVR